MIDSIVQVQETLQGMSEGLARDRQHVHHNSALPAGQSERRLEEEEHGYDSDTYDAEDRAGVSTSVRSEFAQQADDLEKEGLTHNFIGGCMLFGTLVLPAVSLMIACMTSGVHAEATDASKPKLPVGSATIADMDMDVEKDMHNPLEGDDSGE